MKQLLNTLFVTTQGAYLSKKNDTVLVSVERTTRLRIPIHTLGGIVCFGNVLCSPFLMGLCGQNNVTISFLTETGKFLCRVRGPVNGNVLLRKEQYRRSDNPQASCQIARSILIAKIANSRIAMLRAQRQKDGLKESAKFNSALNSLNEHIQNLNSDSDDLEFIRGIEGSAANSYFGVFDELIFAEKESFSFTGRNRRPPLDNVNALLSFLYTLLVHDVESALESVGLDPAVGFLHRDRPGRPGLALDMMEELRAYLADRLVLSLINRKQVKAAGFEKAESGAVNMDEVTRKAVIVAWQKRKEEEIVHPFINEKIKLGLLPYVQALLMARFLRGDLQGYPPFLWR